MSGKTYWITGLSGAGKTTIGRLWYTKLRQSGEAAGFLDGGELRQGFGGGLGDSLEGRQKMAVN